MNDTNFVQTVRLTWDERYKMYMKRSKRQLATMLAERDKYDFPDACKEFEKNQGPGETTSASTE